MKQFYKSFRNICKGLEEHGYTEWKKEVKENLLKKNEVQWNNYKKRIEIAYEKAKGFKQKRDLVDFLNHIVSFSFPFLGVMVGLCSSWGMGLNTIILSSDIDTGVTRNLALETTNTMQGTLLFLCMIALIIFVVLFFLCFQIERWLTERNINFKIYLSELLKIINETEESGEWKSKKETANDKLVSDPNV